MKTKMRKIDIGKFKYKRGNTTLDYPMRQNLKDMLMFRVSGGTLYDRIPIGNKIMLSDNHVLLTEEEWKKLEQAIRAFPNCTSNDEELIKRVFEAEKVEVEERK